MKLFAVLCAFPTNCGAGAGVGAKVRNESVKLELEHTGTPDFKFTDYQPFQKKFKNFSLSCIHLATYPYIFVAI